MRAAERAGWPWAKGLVNALLRRFARSREALLAQARSSPEGRYSYPGWWIDRLRADYPESWEAILEAGNQRPGMALRVNIRRTTASGLFNQPLGPDANLAASFVWGQNRSNHETSNAYLLEAAWQQAADTIYGRAERVEKSGHELILPEPLEHEMFDVSSIALGYVRDVVRDRGLDVGIGAQLTLGHNPEALADLYGGRWQAGYQVFLRLRPSRLRAHGM